MKGVPAAAAVNQQLDLLPCFCDCRAVVEQKRILLRQQRAQQQERAQEGQQHGTTMMGRVKGKGKAREGEGDANIDVEGEADAEDAISEACDKL